MTDANFDLSFDKIPSVFIQWKGTDACLDLRCECGALGHLDAMFAYYVKCAACGAIYEMPQQLDVRRIEKVPDGACEPIPAEAD